MISMSTVVQYDFFKSKELSEIEALKEYCDEIKESCNKVRKGIYAKHGELNKKYIELEARLNLLEKNICLN